MSAWKLGRDVAIGDALWFGKEGFVVVALEPYKPATAGAGRIARNYRGEGMVVFDNHQTQLHEAA